MLQRMTADCITPEHRPVVVAPTYNNAETLRAVLDKVVAACPNVIVVNDGSSDNTAAILEAWNAANPDAAIDVIHHELNRGKAAALMTGFERARVRGYTHAVTIDTDGQLDPGQIPDLVTASVRAPSSIVLGARDTRADDYPVRSRFGRWLSDLSARLETGQCVQDSQCGFRVYPLIIFDVIQCRMGGFSFEPEVITRAIWAGCGVENVPVHCRYFQGAKRVTHLSPVRDGLLGAWIHVWLLARALLPIRVPQIPFTKGPAVADRGSARPSVWARLGRWLSPAELWRQLRRDHASRTTVATGVGLGVFIAALPCYGLHTILSLYVARRLHIHPLAVVLGSQAAAPPLSPFLIIASIWVGFTMLHARTPTPADFDTETIDLLDLFGRVLVEWTVGAVAVGAVLGVVVALFTFAAVALLPYKKLK